MIFLDMFLAEVDKKISLANTIKEQMQPLFDQQIVSPQAMQYLKLARESLEACKIQLSQDPQGAIYLFSRGCWNLGAAVTQGRLEKEAK